MKTKIFCITIFITIFSDFSYAQQDIKKFVDKYNDPSFTVVEISEEMFGLFGEFVDDEDDEDLSEIIEGLKSIYILSSDSKKDGMYDDALSMIVSKKKYKALVNIQNADEKVKILIHRSGKIIKELLLFVDSNDEFVMISLTGDINIKKISKLGKKMDIKQLEHLENLDD